MTPGNLPTTAHGEEGERPKSVRGGFTVLTGVSVKPTKYVLRGDARGRFTNRSDKRVKVSTPLVVGISVG